MEIPCGSCIGCRLERSRQWAIRCMHEASLFDFNSYLTLTYDRDHLPASGSLVLKDFQDFMKRLRKKRGPGIRVVYAGEYGERKKRPHFHAILFNCGFPDRKPSGTRNGFTYYESEELSRIWTAGGHVIGDVSFESCAYVARYILKKVNGEKAAEHYGGLTPEFMHSSTSKGGIGAGWVKKWAEDSYKDDKIIMRERPMRPPAAYDRIYQKMHPHVHLERKLEAHQASSSRSDQVKFARKRAGQRWKARGLEKRLEVREKVKMLQLKQLKRGYEDEG